MGAQQSSSREHNDASAIEGVKRCYYEVLGVERSATEDEIKKGYRRKALELHPDRNYGNVAVATASFAEVSSAYEVLSDPQERAWYDSHRDSILHGGLGEQGEDQEHSVRVTSASDIVDLISRFNASVPFTDGPNGFYGSLRDTFANLAMEEDAACDWEGREPVDYPDFGRADDEYEDGVKIFYRVWINFSTKKTFSWRDAYRASDAPDRATRRLIEKENKRLREDGIREFNDAVRSLVAFVRKRDPRYTPNSQTEADRQKILRDAAAAQAARSRAVNQAKFEKHVVPDWAQSGQQQEEEHSEEHSDSEESIVEHIECVVCGKIFKNEKQYEAHEKSKKHIKAVQQLQRQMRKENDRLDLDETRRNPTVPASESEQLDVDEKTDLAAEDDSATSMPEYIETRETGEKRHKPGHDFETPEDSEVSGLDSRVEGLDFGSSDSDGDGNGNGGDDDQYAPRKLVEEHVVERLLDEAFREDGPATPPLSDGDGQRIGKAKLKRAKKRAKQEQAVQDASEHKCVACNDSFPSKSKLFNHIKEFKHAKPVSMAKSKNPKKKH